jgi:hypothetical protein
MRAASGLEGRFSSGSGVRRCGASKSAVASGHSAASMAGEISTVQPGNTPPPIMRVTTSMSCDSAKSGSTCSACDSTGYQSRRRWMVIAKKPSVV